MTASPWDLWRDGFTLHPATLSAGEVAALLGDLEGRGRLGAGRGGVRDLLNLAAVADVPAVRALAEEALGPGAFVVRCTLFDKTPDANWKVPWHQDLTIAVKRREEVPGFGPWSVKAGVVHVQPTADVLEAMVSVRLHLDPCPGENGALRVVPRTHREGKLTEARLAERRREPAVVCALDGGGALRLRPLLLHASSASTSPAHRRVLHLDFAAQALPGGLQWQLR
jgi:ectoine hydroxylase-related dioxygenase (phytanoyl-CoA dioxygenase family)